MEEEQQQQAQQAQAQAQQQQQVDQAKMMGELSKSKLNMASAQEKMANIENLHSKAEHERTQADLDLVKTIVELEDMQYNQFKNAFEYAQAIKEANRLESQLNQQTAVG